MIEEVLVDLRQKIRAEFGADIVDLNAEKADSVVLNAVPDDRVFIGEQESFDGYPVIELNASVTENFDGSQDERAPAGLIHRHHQVSATVWEQDAKDPERLTIRLFRYAKALSRLMERNMNGGDSYLYVNFREFDYSPTFRTQSKGYIRAVQLRFDVLERD